MAHVIEPTPPPASIDRLPVVRAALEYARRVHATQTRTCDGAPFIEHPLEVAQLLDEAGCSEALVAAALLHDTVERTTTTPEDIVRRFGVDVAQLVDAVTEDPAIRSYSRRKKTLREQVGAAGTAAAVLFSADKLSKVREYRVQLTNSDPLPPRARRLLHYRQSLDTLEAVIPSHPLVTRLREELTEVEALAKAKRADEEKIGRGLSR